MNRQIKLSDLSVGDWVEVGDGLKVQVVYPRGRHDLITVRFLEPQIVQAITIFETTVTIDQVRPIPITRKILLDNGFVRNNEYYYMYCNKDLGFTFKWFTKNHNTVSNSYKRGKVHIIGVNIRYVHQLQHLLRLAGIDEQIKL